MYLIIIIREKAVVLLIRRNVSVKEELYQEMNVKVNFCDMTTFTKTKGIYTGDYVCIKKVKKCY